MKKTMMQKQEATPLFTKQFFDLHLRDLEVRKRELDFKKDQNEKNFEFATSSLQIQSEDMKNQRETDRKREKSVLSIVVLALTMFFCTILLSLYLGKDDLLLEMAKIAGYLFGGGITGYGLGMQKAKHKEKAGAVEA